MAANLTSREISAQYNRFARWYDWVEGVPDLLGIKRLRQRLLKQAFGSVLEVAVGTGKNLPHYPPGCRITAVDVSGEMLNVARKRAEKLRVNVSFVLADAEALPFSGKTFDIVASSLTTCTFPNPVAALGDMARVCRTGGRILLLEHGRSDREWLARWQDWRDESHSKQLGCHWNRETLDLVREAGLKVSKARRHFFGVFHQIEAEP